MSMLLERRCWWCSSKLSSVSHAEVLGPDGTVWVHKCCEGETRGYFRKVTAAPRTPPMGPTLIGGDW